MNETNPSGPQITALSSLETSAREAAHLRARLEGKHGRAFWRGLEELSDSPEFRRFLEREFPSIADGRFNPARRDVLKIMGASLALAGLAGCEGEADRFALPYVEAPEFVIPDKAKYFATAALMGGYAQPVLGETHVGRPTKLEGNPRHPASLGATDAFTQAAVLGLYDPDRSRTPRHLGRPAGWEGFDTAAVAMAARVSAAQGEGFRLLTGAETSPTLKRQIDAMMRLWPQARWHVFESVNEDLRAEAARLAFGRALDRHLRLDESEATISLDDDILGPGPRQTYHGRLWAARRLAFQAGKGECRLLVAEASPSITGVTADRRLAISPSRIPEVAFAIGSALGLSMAATAPLDTRESAFVTKAAALLERHRGRSILTIGAEYAPEVQALVLQINEWLGNLNRTIRFTEPLQFVPPDGRRSLEALAEDMIAGRVTTLAVLDSNPAYTTPADIPFADLMSRVDLRFHAGQHFDETAALCHWHAPLLHELESWSDARAVDGLVTILQPLVRPFFGGRSRHAVMQTLLGEIGASDYDVVRRTWAAAFTDGFEQRWAASLLRGFVEDSAPPFVEALSTADLLPPSPAPEPEELVVQFRPDSSVYDGRFANIAWLQELPKPLTKITWDTPVLIAPALAERLNLSNEDEVTVSVKGRTITGPVWIMPGQDPRTVTVYLGYGRGPIGRVMEDIGYNAYKIRASDSPWHVSGARIAATGRRWPLATTQLHFAMEGFAFVRTVTLEEARGSEWAERAEKGRPLLRNEEPDEPVQGRDARAPTFYPVYEYGTPSWGMSIDLDLCIGCNACIVACVAENNIPMVGKEQVAMGREMHWLRVDRYYEGDPNDPTMYFQPVPCMHCEKAPCEMGCPVNATVHSPGGLNQQIYNRCIGTRTCSSFCPYKVRRFNWFDYTGDDPPPMKAVRNPDVTVRDRGVMEKCTYCVQRISEARIQAKIEGRPIRDGEVKTACQQACPTQAIVFGDVSDPTTQVSLRKASARDYSLLEEVNTWPRTTYLARIEEEKEPDDLSGAGTVDKG